MKRRLPLDRPTLDRMVCGRDEIEGWEALVAEPDSAAAWMNALDRRLRIDRLASLVRMHSWLASPLLACRRASRRAPESRVEPFHGVIERSLVEIVLDMGTPPERSISVPWGMECLVSLFPGEILQFSGPTPGTLLYLTSTSRGRLRGSWRMEAGESPVLLVGVAADVSGLDDALSSGTRLGVCLLVENAFGENEP